MQTAGWIALGVGLWALLVFIIWGIFIGSDDKDEK